LRAAILREPAESIAEGGAAESGRLGVGAVELKGEDPSGNRAQMACLTVLKQEIRALEQAFPRTHSCVQILSASVDELTCRFVETNGKKHVVHANITVRTNLNYFKKARKGNLFTEKHRREIALR
jgi:hypothetical protein